MWISLQDLEAFRNFSQNFRLDDCRIDLSRNVWEGTSITFIVICPRRYSKLKLLLYAPKFHLMYNNRRRSHALRINSEL